MTRRRWLRDDDFAELVALSQLLPGPASSQLGLAIGMLRAGPLGGLAAWLGFTLPSAVLMIAFAYGVGGRDVAGAGWVHGLELAALAVVAVVVWQMGRTLATGPVRLALAAAAAAAVLVFAGPVPQLLVIAAGALVGWRLLAPRSATPPARPPLAFGVSRRAAAAALAVALGLLAMLPLARRATDAHAVDVAAGMYQSGALVFGGGHVVLPLLHARSVDQGWVSESDFVAGYGAAQALPGPLFTFAAYLGAVSDAAPAGVAGGTLALVAIFLPGLLLVAGAAPLWGLVRARPGSAGVLAGVNAAVVGLLAAALYSPLATTAIGEPLDVAVALGAVALLALVRLPPWAVVAACAAAGQLLA